ncbi:PREDICTED: deoxyribodipyrimidine photo-lyase-like [Amphimedon queenslandica]|uniref:Deoxyribodipyrimidine photo-lyase n=2 Tax=Amphimedon queenslandica TaxID=400682 RepID=A0AAN0JUX6_AMPQE|nr:PREDICTED: deoxyribodipyrimidine photo-lyase-like [Amphimedon queenslandica]|eukprot:XP_019860679.1 PREDICTED: deoxyribodipyrimidine photo-lyase-like [Amphimedon queenslandica]
MLNAVPAKKNKAWLAFTATPIFVQKLKMAAGSQAAGAARGAALQESLLIAGSSFNMKRCRLITKPTAGKSSIVKGPVLYWMSRDQRVQDNWGLVYSQELANKHGVPLLVAFTLVPKFLDATWRQYSFMMSGLQEVEKELLKLKIPFHLLLGKAQSCLPPFIAKESVSVVVCDFSPLRVSLGWVKETGAELDKIKVPLVQVDAHNIVPVWLASDKQEYAARTLRNKIHKFLPEFLTEFPLVTLHTHNSKLTMKSTNWIKAKESLEVDMTVSEVSWATPGTNAGLKVLDDFCTKRLKFFAAQRNDPNKDSLSNLSPWFHFGQVGVQRAILKVKSYSSKHSESVSAYIEEAVVRRELADNFCYYNPHYDSISGAAQWAQDTLKAHKKDKREYIYTQEQFESSSTHDPLWNAAQLQMVQEGKMHGFLRMYWAKKILEWTSSPEEGLRIAIYLNDKYEIDGRDPNGYVGKEIIIIIIMCIFEQL